MCVHSKQQFRLPTLSGVPRKSAGGCPFWQRHVILGAFKAYEADDSSAWVRVIGSNSLPDLNQLCIGALGPAAF